MELRKKRKYNHVALLLTVSILIFVTQHSIGRTFGSFWDIPALIFFLESIYAFLVQREASSNHKNSSKWTRIHKYIDTHWYVIYPLIFVLLIVMYVIQDHLMYRFYFENHQSYSTLSDDFFGIFMILIPVGFLSFLFTWARFSTLKRDIKRDGAHSSVKSKLHFKHPISSFLARVSIYLILISLVTGLSLLYSTSHKSKQAFVAHYSTNSYCSVNYYKSTGGDCVHYPSTNPSGATAQCRNGIYSYSEHHQGSCSGDGGVARWLN